MASSSRNVERWKYDVFLSFRGPDTRNTFVAHLHKRLDDYRMKVFIDNELQRGEVITKAILDAIKESRISIVVISKTFASSTFCLEELEKILECRESIHQIVIPIFYHVNPDNVEKQKGDFGKEFSIHEAPFTLRRVLSNTFANVRSILMWPNYWDDLDEQCNNDAEATTNADCVKKWRTALSTVAGLGGYHLTDGQNESDLIEKMIKSASKRLKQKPLDVADHLVGLVSRVKFILQRLNTESIDVGMIGLHGMVKIGKTTTAMALYNKLVSEFEFDGCCFLSEVGERARANGIGQLQQTLIFEITGEDRPSMHYSGEGTEIQTIFNGMKVLILLDAVDQAEQLRKLAGGAHWFGRGSIIIITTPDLRVLQNVGVNIIHEIKKLEDSEATQLFSLCAFGNSEPDEDCSRVIRYANGHPFALRVLGFSLRPKIASEWDEVLDNLERDPNNEINKALRVSYEILGSEEKTIFKDISFYLKGKHADVALKFLNACGFHRAHGGIERLKHLSLVNVDDEGTLEMHDLQQEIGTNIARDESSRLCIQNEMEISRPSLRDVEILLLDLCGEEEVALNFLKDLRKLRVLEIRNGRFSKMPKELPNGIRWLKWPKCFLKSIQPGFLPANIVVLEMPSSSIRKFLYGKSRFFLPKNHEAQKFEYLIRMNFSGCEHLKKIDDFSAVPNLEELDLQGCRSLKKVGVSLGSLEKLKKVDLDGCSSLTSLPNLESQRLESINLNRCSSLENLPNLPRTLTSLYMSDSRIKEIPSFISNLTKLDQVNASNCKNLKSVSNEIYKLPCISHLDLSNCPNIHELPVPEAESSTISSNPSSRVDCCLNLSGNKFVSLPQNIFKFVQIRHLILNNCHNIVEIPNLPHCLITVEARNCGSLERFSHVQSESFEGDFTNCYRLQWNETQVWRTTFRNLSQKFMEVSVFPHFPIGLYILSYKPGRGMVLFS